MACYQCFFRLSSHYKCMTSTKFYNFQLKSLPDSIMQKSNKNHSNFSGGHATKLPSKLSVLHTISLVCNINTNTLLTPPTLYCCYGNAQLIVQIKTAKTLKLSQPYPLIYFWISPCRASPFNGVHDYTGS